MPTSLPPHRTSPNNSGNCIMADDTGQDVNLIPSNVSEPIEADLGHRDSDSDSAFGGSTGNPGSSINTSLKSFVRDYYYENGRRYHSFRQGEYNLPNDDREQERLEYYHWCWLMLRGGRLFNAPIGNSPQRVLDLGTGTGVWAIEFADRYPSAEVLGNDLSPIQPSWVPPNCRFIVDDVASVWVYRPDEAFDFIHARMLNGALSDWPRLYEQALEHLKPGGWVEFQEFAAFIFSDDDPELKKAPTLKQYMDDVTQCSKMIGKDMDISHTIKQSLIDAGFVDVREDLYKVPFGSWSANNKLLGELSLECVSESIDAYGFTLMTRVLGKSAQEARELIAQVTDEFRDKNNHFFGRFRFVYGRKQEVGEEIRT